MKNSPNIKSNVDIKKIVIVLNGLLVLSIFIGSSIAMADIALPENNTLLTPELAPLNPHFVKYQAENSTIQSNTSMDSTSVDGQKTGLIPSPVDLNHLNYISSTDVSTPVYYDLRSLNRITTTKDQGKIGTCWIFATYGSLESYFRPEETWDFSENNVKNLLISASPEGFDKSPDDGGNQFRSTAYLARWSGPVGESDDPYSPYSLTSSHDLVLQKHVQNVLFIPGKKGHLDNNEIKLAVQNNGAMYTTFYYNKTFYSPTNCSYYYDGSSGANHAVDIVGWDDSFDNNKFSKIPPGDGAFIVKNSWGTGWGDKGYFYVSYYDSKIGKDNAVFTAESPDNYKSIYQYDPLGMTSLIGYRNPSAWCANVFTVKSDETVKAMSFYTTDSNCDYEVYIYTNPVANPINQFGPVFSKSGTISVAGYHTIPLGSGVRLKAGQKFSVVLKVTTPNYNYPIAIEKPISGWSSKVKANTGESFISPDGKVWTDMTTYYSNTNVCIKAFTV
jgi:C1A family cysteine protease